MKNLFASIAVVLSAAAFAVQGASFSADLVANLPSPGGASFGSNPSQGATMGGYFYFAASDGPSGTTGRELWRTDGTTAGTSLVKDIRSGAADSSPSYFTAAGTNLYFFADDGVHGLELWKSDGTSAGTVFVADLAPGTTNTLPGTLKPAGNWLYFTVTVIIPGGGPFPFPSIHSILYRSDGTAVGTFKLSDPGGNVTTNAIAGFDVYNTDVIVTVIDNAGASGMPTNSLWRFGGAGPYFAYPLETYTNALQSLTVAGTNCYFIVQSNSLQLLRRRSVNFGGVFQAVDVSPSGFFSTESGILFSRVENDRLYYNTFVEFEDDSRAYGLKSVGNALPTVAVEGSQPDSMEVVGSIGANTYYRRSTQQFYRTTGTSAGVLAFDFQPTGFTPYNFVKSGSRFFIYGDVGTYAELGVTDFTAGGTHLIDSVPGTNQAFPEIIGSVGVSLIYRVDDGFSGTEPWRTDGTTNGTYLIKDIAAGIDTVPPTTALAVGGLYFFALDTAGMGVELWRSDGTESGTAFVKDIRAGTNSSGLANFTAFQGLLYFTANDGTNGVELWRSDGTPGGTFMVVDGRIGPAGSNPSQLTVAGNLIFFVADDGAHGLELWRSDGTALGTYMTQDIIPGVGGSFIRGLGAAGGKVYFLAGTSSTSGQLWFSTGQPGGTQFLKDFGTIPAGSPPEMHFTAYNGAVYFGIQTLASSTLCKTDDTPEGTIPFAAGVGYEIVASGGILFLSGNSGLWRSDGIAQGTFAITNFPGLRPVRNLAASGAEVFFTVNEDLWKSDGTTNGTTQAADFPAAVSDVEIKDLKPFLGALVFTANTPTYGREWWATAPGQIVTQIQDLTPLSGSPGISLASAGTNKVFYIARAGGQPNWQVRALRLESLAPPPQAPWNGATAIAPCVIESEDFDTGGEGTAYHDTGIVNEGGYYRVIEAVDLKPSTDTNGGFVVTLTQPGEWLEYTFTASQPAVYQLEMRVAAAGAGATFEVTLDGGFNSTPITIPNTGGLWTNVIVGTFAVNTGATHVLRLICDTADGTGVAGEFNWLRWNFFVANSPPSVSLTSPIQNAIYDTNSGVSLAATITDATSAPAPVADFYVDGQLVGSDSTSPYRVTWAATPGAHSVYVRATDSFGATNASATRTFFVADPKFDLDAEWSYYDGGAISGAAWRGINFDDRSWTTGGAQLGFGDGDETTVLESSIGHSAILTYYFRKRVELKNVGPFTHGSITLLRDDGAIVYVNGTEVGRFNLPKGTITYTNLAVTNINNQVFGSDQAIDTFVVPTGVLTNGDNVVAVEVHQASTSAGSQFDISFALAFSTFNYLPSLALQIRAAGTNALISWPDDQQGWQLQRTTDFNSWTPVTTGIGLQNGVYLFTEPITNQDFFQLRLPATP